jgi:hypothetical protein
LPQIANAELARRMRHPEATGAAHPNSSGSSIPRHSRPRERATNFSNPPRRLCHESREWARLARRGRRRRSLGRVAVRASAPISKPCRLRAASSVPLSSESGRPAVSNGRRRGTAATARRGPVRDRRRRPVAAQEPIRTRPRRMAAEDFGEILTLAGNGRGVGPARSCTYSATNSFCCPAKSHVLGTARPCASWSHH